MIEKIPPRLLWASRHLALDDSADLLEVGCGHGILTGLVCERLAAGSLVAIDRSARMIAAAQKRNAAHVAAGRISFHVAELADANFGGRHFDRIFAVNVNVFWIDPRRELEAVRRLLKPGPGLTCSTNRRVQRRQGRSRPCLAKSSLHVVSKSWRGRPNPSALPWVSMSVPDPSTPDRSPWTIGLWSGKLRKKRPFPFEPIWVDARPNLRLMPVVRRDTPPAKTRA